MPRFSIVTVCYNAAGPIVPSARSLGGQTCTDFEWLVVDGASTDQTLQAVTMAAIPNTRVVSEPDRGIYDAMNKAALLAKGDWVYFLNAGDELADSDVLTAVAQMQDANPAVELLYGDMIYVGGGQERRRSFAHVRPGMLVFEDLNHQAIFSRRDLFQRIGPFDLRFRTSADYDWLLRVVRARAPIHYIPRVIARFQIGGAHAADVTALGSERHALRLNYVPSWLLWLGIHWASVRRVWRVARGQLG